MIYDWPLIVRRPSWRRQSQVLQKARRFEAAYLKQRQDEQQRRYQPQNRFGQEFLKKLSNMENQKLIWYFVYIFVLNFCEKFESGEQLWKGAVHELRLQEEGGRWSKKSTFLYHRKCNRRG